MLALLAHPNIASKAATIHRYDHEIGGGTVRPLVGRHGDPGDGVVLADPRDTHGFAVGVGVNPWYGVHDPRRWPMRWWTRRSATSSPWVPTPTRSRCSTTSHGVIPAARPLGQLVAAVDGCHDAAVAHAAPFVSADSLNNEYTGADGARHGAADAGHHGRRPRRTSDAP